MTLRFILQVIRPFWPYLLGPVLVICVDASYVSLESYLAKRIIDAAMTAHGMEALEVMWPFATWIMVWRCILPCMWRLWDWCELKYEPALANHIARTMMAHLQDHSYHFFQDQFAGSIGKKIGDAVDAITTLVTISIHYIGLMVMISVATYTLWQVHLWFAMGMMLWGCSFLLLSAVTLGRYNHLEQNAAEAGSRIMGAIVDTLANMSAVRFFVGKQSELQQLGLCQEAYLRAHQIRRWMLLKCYFVQGLSISLYQLFCLLLLMHLYSQGQVTPGDFAMIFAINTRVIDHFWQLADKMRNFSEQWGKLGQALLLMEAQPEVQDAPGAKALQVREGAITLSHVHFHYQGATPLFQDLSVTLAPGKKVGLVGYSGGGKTSFVHLLLRLFDATEGSITIDGQEIAQVTQDSLRAHIGMIPQDPSLFHRTLMENIRYGRMDASDEEVIEAAKRADAHGFITALPDGYHSLVGERGIKLSGGQRQRIAIARAFLKDAPILILDEATSQLDSVTEQHIQASLLPLMEGKTTLVIAHRLSTLLHMDRILVFEQGQIVEDGDHATLLAKGERYSELWEAQVGGFLPEKREGEDGLKGRLPSANVMLH